MANTRNLWNNNRNNINTNIATQHTKLPFRNIATKILWICNFAIGNIFSVSRNNKENIHKEKWGMAVKNLKRQKENIYKEKRRAIINKSSK